MVRRTRPTPAPRPSPHVAEYIEQLAGTLAPLSVKLHLAALKHWFDWLVTGHVLPVSPAAAVRGPRCSQSIGKTPVLNREQAKALLQMAGAVRDVIACAIARSSR